MATRKGTDQSRQARKTSVQRIVIPMNVVYVLRVRLRVSFAYIRRMLMENGYVISDETLTQYFYDHCVQRGISAERIKEIMSIQYSRITGRRRHSEQYMAVLRPIVKHVLKSLKDK